MIDLEELAGLIFFGLIIWGDIELYHWCAANGWTLWFVLVHIALVGIAVNSEPEKPITTRPNDTP